MDSGGERLAWGTAKDDSEVGAVVDDEHSVEAVVVTGNDLGSSGSCVIERRGDQVDTRELADEGNQNGERLPCSPGVNTASPSVSGGSAPKKGYGLKKWKRIRRDGVIRRSVSPSLDTGKVLKRGVSGINNPSSQLPHFGEEKQGSGDFVGPVNALDNNLEGLSYFAAQASSSTVFAMGAVSENSEDRSSKSSTAASAPRHGIGMPLGSPISVDKKKPKNPSGKVLNNSNQMGQTGKGRADPSKKLRGGEKVKYEKEISRSSLESDSRSSNFVFLQTSNRRQSEASVNYNEESDEVIPGEPHFTDDQTRYSQANAREAEDILPHDLDADFSWKGNEENDGNHQSPTTQDPLADSIRTLDSVREALEKELQKFKEIGKDSYFTSADTAVSVNLSEHSNGKDMAQDAHGSSNLAEKITVLESALEETRDALRMKELKVSEPAATRHSAFLPHGDTNNKTQEQGAAKKLELELEILFAQKLEADVKYITTANAIQDAKHAVANSKTMLAEHNAIAEEQLIRLKQTECKAGKIKRRAEELETYSADIADAEQAQSVGRSLRKLTLYSLSQLLMLLIAFWAVYLQLNSDSGVVVPT